MGPEWFIASVTAALKAIEMFRKDPKRDSVDDDGINNDLALAEIRFNSTLTLVCAMALLAAEADTSSPKFETGLERLLKDATKDYEEALSRYS